MPGRRIPRYRDIVLRDNPSGFWPLDQPNSILFDLGPQANTANVVGPVTLGPGPFPNDPGIALQYNGTTSEVDTLTSRTTPTVFSSECWFATTVTGGMGLMEMVDAQTGISASSDRALFINSTNHLSGGTWDGAAQLVSSANTVTDGRWHHAVLTISGSGGIITVYLDGVSQGTIAVGTMGTYTAWWQLAHSWASSWGSAAKTPMAGQFAYAAVYENVVLTATQVQTHYQAMTAPIGSLGWAINLAPSAGTVVAAISPGRTWQRRYRKRGMPVPGIAPASSPTSAKQEPMGVTRSW